jgi:CubicO group peptidase (beta-lactamase class C family)
MVAFTKRSYWPTREWSTSPPSSQNLDEQTLREADRHILAHLPNVTSLIVVRHGLLVYEQYYDEHGPGVTQNIQSVTKSILSACVGIAFEQGYLDNLEQRVMDFFPEYAGVVRDERMYDVTLRHLLTMSSGLVNEVSVTGLHGHWLSSSDSISFTLSQHLQAPPGHTMQYSDQGAHLLSAILTRAIGRTTVDFASQMLFTPLGIQPGLWAQDASGYAFGSSRLCLTPRDMAKFGYLYLNHGWWEKRAIVSPKWVTESTQHHVPGDPWIESLEGYGYLWWIATIYGHAAYYAAGYGGQYIAAIPALDLVIAMTGDARDVSQDHRYIIDDFVIPAAR